MHNPFRSQTGPVLSAIKYGLLAAVLTVAGGPVLSAQPPAPDTEGLPDCPAAFRPYSLDRTAFVDVLLDPRAVAIVERDAPGLFAKLPQRLKDPAPPTFAAILSLGMVLGMDESKPNASPAAAQIQRDLSGLPITPDLAQKRCARYDHVQPELPKILTHPAILVFSKINGFKDDPSVSAAEKALRKMAEQKHWTLVFSQNGAVFNSAQLARFDAVVWNNVSGDVLTVPQREAFKNYLERGGAYAGFHGSGGDPFYDWDWYVDDLLGARFLSHPMNPQFQEALLKVDDPSAAIVRGLPLEWRMTDEWYSFKSDPRTTGSHVLVTIDESSYSPRSGQMDLRMGDHPMAWTRRIGKGRMFYTALGHRPESYDEPNTFRLIAQGIEWAATTK